MRLYTVPVKNNKVAVASRYGVVKRTLAEYKKGDIEVDSEYISNLELLQKELEELLKLFDRSDGITCCVNASQLSLLSQTVENERLRRVVIN